MINEQSIKELQKTNKILAQEAIKHLKDILGFTVGDPIWYYTTYNGLVHRWSVTRQGTITRIGFSTAGINITIREVGMKSFMLGKQVFLTKEACDMKLEYERNQLEKAGLL